MVVTILVTLSKQLYVHLISLFQSNQTNIHSYIFPTRHLYTSTMIIKNQFTRKHTTICSNYSNQVQLMSIHNYAPKLHTDRVTSSKSTLYTITSKTQLHIFKTLYIFFANSHILFQWKISSYLVQSQVGINPHLVMHYGVHYSQERQLKFPFFWCTPLC